MAENTDMLQATQPDATALTELDQPGGQDALSLDDVREMDETEQAEGEEATGAEIQEGDAGPQSGARQERTFTQAEFDRIFGERANGLRRQFEREHREELSLAEMVRGAFPDMGLEDIEDALLGEQARRLAEETGWDESEAKEKIKARRQFERTGRTGEQAEDPHVALLRRQLHEINEREGVDMLAIINKDEYLAEQVDTGAMDIKDAYIHYMKNQGGPPARKAPPRVEKRASPAGANIASRLSDRDVDRIDEALRSGRRVRLD